MGVTQGTCLGLLLFTVWKELGRVLSGCYSGHMFGSAALHCVGRTL